MKDMFYNYDHNINNCEAVSHGLECNLQKDLMTSDSTVFIVYDLKGREIGMQVKHNNAFTLYFTIEDIKNCLSSSLAEIMEEGLITFKILSTKHKIIIEKELVPENVFDIYSGLLAINITTEESKKLSIDSYGMSLVLDWSEDSYELFSETDGLLIVR